MKLTRVRYLDPPEPDVLAGLREALDPSIDLRTGRELPDAADFQVLVGGRPDPEHLRASPDLGLLVIPYAGLPAVTRERMADLPNVAVHNLHHNAVPTAEMAITLLTAAAKRLLPIDRKLREDDHWERRAPGVQLDGKTALILGYGQIGRRVARACRGLGMHTLAIRRRPDAPGAPGDPTELFGTEALHDLLPRSNALLICLPATPDTEDLIGEHELALLPPDALLVNIARGPIVSETPLYEALRDGRLYGAGLDVWYQYPANRDEWSGTPPSAHPFGSLDNVVMSPHRGGWSPDTEPMRAAHLARLLNAAARGEPIPNPVDIRAGY